MRQINWEIAGRAGSREEITSAKVEVAPMPTIWTAFEVERKRTPSDEIEPRPAFRRLVTSCHFNYSEPGLRISVEIGPYQDDDRVNLRSFSLSYFPIESRSSTIKNILGPVGLTIEEKQVSYRQHDIGFRFGDFDQQIVITWDHVIPKVFLTGDVRGKAVIALSRKTGLLCLKHIGNFKHNWRQCFHISQHQHVFIGEHKPEAGVGVWSTQEDIVSS